MGKSEMDELAQRVDGVARVLMALIADLEMSRQVDGERFCQGLRSYAAGRGTRADLEVSARTIAEIAGELEGARAARREAGRAH